MIAYIDSMSLNRTKTKIIVASLVLAFVGLVVLQAVLLQRAFESETLAFKRNVQAALGKASARLEALETVEAAMAVAAGGGFLNKDISIMLLAGEPGIRDSIVDSLHVFTAVTDSTMMSRSTIVDTSGTMVVEVHVSDGKFTMDTIIIDAIDSIFDSCGLLRAGIPPLPEGMRYSHEIFWQVDDTHHVNLPVSDFPIPDSGQIGYVFKIVREMLKVGSGSITDRLDAGLLDSVIRLSLVENGIDQPFSYGVTELDSDSMILAHPVSQSKQLAASQHKARLYSSDLFGDAHYMILFFPDEQSFLWWQMAPMLVASIVFVIAIILCLVYTLRIIVEQRRNASLMIEFVNNMTHEFKTPIATVALACEAIQRSDIRSDPERIDKFSGVIRDENQRMRNQAEKILQMAALEEGDWELKQGAVDMHEIIEQVVEGLYLQVSQKSGSLEYSPGAKIIIIPGDAVHLSNVVQNLIDNAIKYSLETPKISIHTRNSYDGFEFSVTDNGIGINSEDQKLVFEKYFRVSSGDRHDVKGFGLGLSYVKLIVTGHGGSISIKSQPAKGTTLTVWLPLRTDSKVPRL